MNTPNQIAHAIAVAHFSSLLRSKFISACIMIGLLLTLGTARADGPDDDYLAFTILLSQADTLSANGQTSQAHAKYVEAQQSLTEFQKDHPGWNDRVVTFRMNYLADKIAGNTEAAAPVTSSAAGANTTAADGSTDAGNQTATPAPAATALTTDMAAPAADAAAPTTEAVAPAAKSPVTLLDAGSEPRTVLRLHPTAGDQQTMTMTMKIGMDMGVAGKAVPAMDLPAMVMSMDVTVKDISANGDITYTLVFNDATISADTNTPSIMATAMKAGLASIKGMSGTGTMSDHGIVKHVDMRLPANANAQLRQTIGQMKDSFSSSSTPLPAEAVGPGARWEYTSQMKSQGMTIDQTISSELVSVQGDQITLRTTITQNAANQKISNPAAPGLKMDLTKMTGNGNGTTSLDLGKLMSSSATLAEKTEVVMGMNIGQQQQTMDMKMDINVAIESK
jgi:hypothetical protein